MSRSLRTVALFSSIVFLLVLGAVLGYFLFINAQWVLVRFPAIRPRLDDPFAVIQLETPLAAVIAVAFVLGFVAALLLMVLPGWLRRGVERRRERRFVSGLEGELTDLRNQSWKQPAPFEDIDEEPVAPKERLPETAEEEERALLAAALHEPLEPSKGSSR